MLCLLLYLMSLEVVSKLNNFLELIEYYFEAQFIVQVEVAEFKILLIRNCVVGDNLKSITAFIEL